MRRVLLIWWAFGACLIGLKAHLDRTVLKYPDVAVRAGADVYYIPRRMAEGEGWRADLKRFAGCWDAREAGVSRLASGLADCDGSQAVKLKIPANELGPDAEIALRGRPMPVLFWRAYTPPDDHLPQLAKAWAGSESWVGRKLILRADWQLFRLEAPGTPWVYLLHMEPQRGTNDELAALYAGRCFRPEPTSDAGITCNFVLTVGPKASIEYGLGPDEMMSMVSLREGLIATTSLWRKAVPTVRRPREPIVAQNYRR